ncbi:hypothetical protein B0O99DRAFT_593931 [Bisporella sp. PMI_857]|nr:hypothetical protein B0O99DRAFT_593931 [Bisporella sp. PMI_857]
MPLFSRREPVHEPVHTTSHTRTGRRVGDPIVEDTPKRSSTLFGRKHSPDPMTTTTRHHTTRLSNSPSPKRHGLLHRDHEDSSITRARNQVLTAEAAEKEADKALNNARIAVRNARDHVKLLEREAAEEARLAKIKQKQAGALGKRGNLLGRHGI